MESGKIINNVVFIGSGISTSFTLLNLINEIESEQYRHLSPVRISIIEKSKEFHKGVPYGYRSGTTVLLITSLADFLPEPELSEFKKWLNHNKANLLDELRKTGGELTGQWITDNKEKIENNEWDDLFIPRGFFGKYISEKVSLKIEESSTKGFVNINYITDEVVSVNKLNGDKYKLELKNNDPVLSEQVVLSIGSPPNIPLWEKSLPNLLKDRALLIHNPYNPTLDETLEKIQLYINKRANKQTNILIVGANASALELLYKLNDQPETKSYIKKFNILSTQGLMPDAVVDEEKAAKYVPENLIALADKTNLSAKEIADATFADLDLADQLEVGAATTVKPISNAFGALLSKLNSDGLIEFACIYGNEIGRRQRCAGLHYSKTVDQLKSKNLFNLIAGRFLGIAHQVNKQENIFFEYLDTKTKKVVRHSEPVDVIINCIGSITFNSENITTLLDQLVRNGLCTPNKSQRGFTVNNNLETSSPGFFVMGPLLAGNVVDNKAIWHVEHCGRIIWLAGVMAKKVVKGMVNQPLNV